jgi:hypothetical protein
MKKALLCFLVLLYSITAFCQHLYKQNLNHVAQITFPDTPKMQHDNAGTFYSVTVDRNIYLAQVAIAKKSLRDLFTSHLNDSIYSGVIEGTLTASKGKLLYKRKITVNGLDGVEFSYRAKIKSLNYYRYHQAFYFNNTLVLYGYWTPDSLQSDNKAIKAFFGTFKVTLPDDEVRQDNVSDIAFRFGYVLGIFLIVSVIVLMGFGIVFIIKKFANK